MENIFAEVQRKGARSLERLQILEDAFQGLPMPYREPLWLYYIQGMSTSEAAEAPGLPVDTLKSRPRRARRRLARRPECQLLHRL